MIAEPTPDVLKATDWGTVARVTKRAQTLARAGRLDKTTFDDLWKVGLVATRSHPELLQTLDMLRPRS